MNLHRSRFGQFLAAAVAALAISCGPSDPEQKVAFVLDLESERVSRIEFVVQYSSGGFSGTDGKCVVGNAAGPRSASVEAAAAQSRAERKATATVVRAPRGAGEPTTTTTAPEGSSSTTSSTSTSTTSTSTTSTTLPTLPTADCLLRFRVLGSATIGAIQWDTDYSAAPGFVAGNSATPECTSLVSGVLVAFNDNDSAQILESGIISLTGFPAPADLVECVFKATAQPEVADFVITVVDAADPDSTLLDPFPSVILSSLECEGLPVTTTSTTMGPVTTSTLPGPARCGNGVVDSGEECDDDNSTPGDGCDGACKAEFDFTAVDDDSGDLTIRILNGKGIPPGATLALCTFQGDVADADLKVRTTNCGFPDGSTCNPATDVTVSVSTTTTTTTTTTTNTVSDTTTTTEE
ncbi:MAG: hypothetical protein ABR538_13605 [Candidatus Binatia bacterium]